MHVNLKTAIVESGLKSYNIAKEMKIHYTRLSKIVMEVQKPREAEKKALAKILRKTVKELFSTEVSKC